MVIIIFWSNFKINDLFSGELIEVRSVGQATLLPEIIKREYDICDFRADKDKIQPVY